MSKVGIIANPVSARDIRRIVSHAGNLPINDRANIVLRMLTGLATAGVEEVVIMPENGGIRTQLMRTITRENNMGTLRFPKVTYLDMPVTCTADDSAEAARQMAAQGVGAIAVLGGDGTNRVVVANSGNTPIAGVSTGTNNAFPELREPTITGLAVGLAVTGQVPPEYAFQDNKLLEVRVNDDREIALVDVAVVAERFVGARAIWKTANFRDLFTTFGLPEGIGMSSIVGLLAPLDRQTPEGRRVRLVPLERADASIIAPIAPGLIEEVGIGGVERMDPNVLFLPSVSVGSIALDGERELTFSETDDVSIRLKTDAFRTVNVPACMAFAAKRGLLTREVQTAVHEAL
ncbi:ATP-NAD kinase family protein [Actibacterium atlanticum]|uniref:ATP-NAD kinase family protein n=1 Tax=Actibacterium atlanticum TaxID=1461693 RepID=UPI0005520374|nr:NAD(+)/NADH kinase [Actibacterium atlanticum]